MRHLTLNIPDNLDLNDQEIVMTLAAKLYENRKLTLGQAAELTGLTKRTFVELLGKYSVSIFNYSPTDLSRDIENASNE